MHRLADNNEDNAPFQINPLGVQAKQLHHIKPPVDENLFSGPNSETLLSSAQDFFEVTLAGEESAFHFIDVPLAFEESASKLLDVTLAQEDDRLGARRTRQKPRVFPYSFYIGYAINI